MALVYPKKYSWELGKMRIHGNFVIRICSFSIFGVKSGKSPSYCSLLCLTHPPQFCGSMSTSSMYFPDTLHEEVHVQAHRRLHNPSAFSRYETASVQPQPWIITSPPPPALSSTGWVVYVGVWGGSFPFQEQPSHNHSCTILIHPFARGRQILDTHVLTHRGMQYWAVKNSWKEHRFPHTHRPGSRRDTHYEPKSMLLPHCSWTSSLV